MGSTIFETFKIMLKNWKVFGGVFLLILLVMLVVVSQPSQETAALTSLGGIFAWLVAIYLTRRLMARERVRVRDGIYGGGATLVSTLVMLAVVIAECVPVMILVVAYTSAVETNLFANLGWGIGFSLFAVAMTAVSMYFLPAAVMALTAVSAPGLYPMEALKATSELMRGKRARFWGKTLILMVTLAVLAMIIMAPFYVMLHSGLVLAPATAVVFQVTSLMAIILLSMVAAVYYYIDYRQLIDGKMEVKNDKKRGRGKN